MDETVMWLLAAGALAFGVFALVKKVIVWGVILIAAALILGPGFGLAL